MATKRHHRVEYMEDSYSDEEEDFQQQSLSEQKQQSVEVPQQMERGRPGRPRKCSATTNSSYEADANFTLTSATTADATSGAGQTRRRGRGPSKRPCLNRNALMARENRQRKKEYIEKIENKLKVASTQNQELSSTIKKQSAEIRRLTSEVAYLKSVLNNNTVITSLLKSMNESLQRMHGDEKSASPSSSGLAKSSLGLNDIMSGTKNSTKTDFMSLPIPGFTNNQSSEGCKKDTRINLCSPAKIARKTMPLTTCTSAPKTENPSSVESLFEDESSHSASDRQSNKPTLDFTEPSLDL